jgi:hypothetical protein
MPPYQIPTMRIRPLPAYLVGVPFVVHVSFWPKVLFESTKKIPNRVVMLPTPKVVLDPIAIVTV